MSSDVAELEREADALPDQWRSFRLGDVATLSGGTTPSRAEPSYWENAAIPWATPSDITSLPAGVSRIADTEAKVSDRALAECSLTLNPPGTVLMTSRATIGFVAVNDVPMATNQGFITFRAGDRLDADFLLYWLTAQRDNLVAAAGGSTFKELSRTTAKLLPILLPPLGEQRRIAEVLRSVDEAIAAAENASTQARSALDGLLLDYFSEGGAHTSLTGLSPLSDLIVLQSGFAFKSEEYQDQGHFLMRISNVQDGQISLENPKFVRLNNKTQAFELQEGDILTSLTGNIGRVARLTVEHLPAALNQRVARIKPKPGAPIDADYLFFSLKSPLFKSGLAGESGGAAQQNVSPKAIGRVEIPLPPMEEQKRTGEMLSAVEDTRVRCDYALEHLRTVKASLMSDLLSGRVRVPA